MVILTCTIPFGFWAGGALTGWICGSGFDTPSWRDVQEHAPSQTLMAWSAVKSYSHWFEVHSMISACCVNLEVTSLCKTISKYTSIIISSLIFKLYLVPFQDWLEWDTQYGNEIIITFLIMNWSHTITSDHQLLLHQVNNWWEWNLYCGNLIFRRWITITISLPSFPLNLSWSYLL